MIFLEHHKQAKREIIARLQQLAELADGVGMVTLELGEGRDAAFSAEDYLRGVPDLKDAKDLKKGIGRYAELFRSHPQVPKRVQALRLFAGSAMYAQATGQDPAGKPSLAEVDRQVSDLISVF